MHTAPPTFLTIYYVLVLVIFTYIFQALTVSVNGETVGTIRERATWLYPVYHVFDSVGNQAETKTDF